MTREDDAKVAEMLGWTWHNPPSWAPELPRKLCPPNGKYLWNFGTLGQIPPHYTSDAGDDYRVLEFVRENWDSLYLEAFATTLDIQLSSHGTGIGGLLEYGNAPLYVTGDYSRAALAVEESEKNE